MEFFPSNIATPTAAAPRPREPPMSNVRRSMALPGRLAGRALCFMSCDGGVISFGSAESHQCTARARIGTKRNLERVLSHPQKNHRVPGQRVAGSLVAPSLALGAEAGRSAIKHGPCRDVSKDERYLCAGVAFRSTRARLRTCCRSVHMSTKAVDNRHSESYSEERPWVVCSVADLDDLGSMTTA